jgi:hypothetical protein
MLSILLSQYQTSRKSQSAAPYHRFDANGAYVRHSLALRQLNQAYNEQAAKEECCHSFDLVHRISNAILVAERKQKYAQNHLNFNLQAALTMLQRAINQ